MTLITAEKMVLMVDFLFPKAMSWRCSLQNTNLTVLKSSWTLWRKKWRSCVSMRWNYLSSCSTTELVGAMVITLMVCLHPPAWHMAQQGFTLQGRVEVGKATWIKHFCQSLPLEALFHLIQENTSLYRVRRLYCQTKDVFFSLLSYI